MTTHKIYNFAGVVILAVFVAAALFGATALNAQTTYAPPAGYTAMTDGSGTYYNSASGLYFYPSSGLFSPQPPTIPSGFQFYANGIYYNPATGSYYNPVTGQYSSLVPLGPATMTNGAYNIPAGYNASVYGTYYNSATGLYYDPTTGFYSPNAPVGPVPMTGVLILPSPSPASSVVPTPTPITYFVPGVPNTGMGGNALPTIILLAFAGALSVAGVTYLGRKMVN